MFGGDSFRSGGDKDEARDWTRRQGIVCFITVAGFLNGPGFQKMRADLRRDADEIWVIDCSPEGHQAPVASRIFDGVQQPVCIVMALRRSPDSPATPARVRFRALPEGGRKAKFEALAGIGLDDAGWTEAPTDPRAPFLAQQSDDWASYPALVSLFVYHGSGIMPGRTWVISPDRETLATRWTRLTSERDRAKKEMLFHPQLRKGKLASRHIAKIVKEPLGTIQTRSISIENDGAGLPSPVRYAFRSFDRQWLIGDARVLNDPRPVLWAGFSSDQIFATALQASSPSGGPAITFTAFVPDQDHYKGSFGGRVFPLWADASASQSNFAQGLLKTLGETYGQEVEPEAMLAYVAAVAAHPAYVARFRANLKQPGLRIPITADGDLFHQAATLGREVVWLHTFGERFAEGRPQGAPRVIDGPEPTIPKDGALPRTLAEMPHDLTYDAAERRLKIGTGHIDNVAPEVWAYEVSGKRVISQWWSYRRADRSKPPMGDKRPPSPLSAIQPTEWPAEYTTELLNVLRVLTRLVALEPQQADLLARIVDGPTIDADDLMETGALSEGTTDAADKAETEE